jgi:hypothetical protein
MFHAKTGKEKNNAKAAQAFSVLCEFTSRSLREMHFKQNLNLLEHFKLHR